MPQTNKPTNQQTTNNKQQTTNMKKLLLTLILGCASVPAFAASLTNGGFETGDFSGWSLNDSGFGTVTTSYLGYTPVEGSYLAGIRSGLGEGVYTILSQTFSVGAGGTVKGSAGFLTGDYLPFDDTAFLNLTGPSGVVTLWFQSVASVGDNGSSGWQEWSSGALPAGSYTLEFGVANVADNGFDSVAVLDNVQVIEGSSVPDGGSTVAMLGLALAAVAGARRKFGI